MPEEKRIPIADAAMRLSVTREVAVRMVMRGEIRGGQDEKGRWYAEEGSVRRAKRQITNRHVAVPV